MKSSTFMLSANALGSSPQTRAEGGGAGEVTLELVDPGVHTELRRVLLGEAGSCTYRPGHRRKLQEAETPARYLHRDLDDLLRVGEHVICSAASWSHLERDGVATACLGPPLRRFP